MLLGDVLEGLREFRLNLILHEFGDDFVKFVRPEVVDEDLVHQLSDLGLLRAVSYVSFVRTF